MARPFTISFRPSRWTPVVGITLALSFGCPDEGGTPVEPDLCGPGFCLLLNDGLDSNDVAVIRDSLANNLERIVNDLDVDWMPRVNVGIWGEKDNYHYWMEKYLGEIDTERNSYITGRSEFRLLLNDESPREALYELAHVVTLNLYLEAEENPRWLWEAVAIYETNRFVDPATLSIFKSGEYPSLAEINDDSPVGAALVNDLGYTLIEFIVDEWGMDKVTILIKKAGDLQDILGLTEVEFMTRWFRFISIKYLGLEPDL